MANSNMLPILLGGGLVLGIAIYFFMKKSTSGAAGAAGAGGAGAKSLACSTPGGVPGMMQGGICVPTAVSSSMTAAAACQADPSSPQCVSSALNAAGNTAGAFSKLLS
jgi:hypothetical protein